MQKKRFKLGTLAAVISAVAAGVASQAGAATRTFHPSPILPAPVTPSDYQREILTNSASIYMTPHGQDYFTSNMLDTFLRNGIALDSAEFANWSYSGNDTLTLDKLSSPMQKFGPTLGSLRDTLKKWLIGFQFNDPKISLQVQGISYKMQIKRLGVRTDPVKTMALRRDNTIIVDLELEIPQISINVANVRATDENNQFLGSFGVNNFSTTMAATSRPLKFRVPVQIAIDSNHHVQIDALAVESNIQLSDLDWDFAHPMVLPSVQISVNGRSTTLSYDQLEGDIRKQERALAKASQAFLKNYLTENGPRLLNEHFQEAKLNTLLDEINSLSPVAAPKDLENPAKLLWGIVIENLKLDQQFLQIDASTFVVDPQNRGETPLLVQPHADTPADLSSVNPSTYDVALSLDEAFIDRLLQMSFLRGYFSNLKNGETAVKLLETPIISPDPNGQKDHIRLHLSIETSVSAKTFTQSVEYSIALKNPMRMSFDMDIKIVPDTALNRIKMVENQVDLESIKVDAGSIKNYPLVGRQLAEKVVSGAKAYVAENINKPLTQTETTIATIPMPRSIVGIPVHLRQAEGQTNGHVVVYFNYGDE